jgi:8-oxo-dGTP pyrophosphatase MutT (NUDIX family)
MGEASGTPEAAAGEGGRADGANRKRRRRPRRATPQGGAEPKTSGAGSGRASNQGGSRTAADPQQKSATQQAAKKKTSRKKGQRLRQKQRTPGKSGRKPRGAPTKREISAGGVVYRRDGDEIEIVLASRRTRRGELAWGLAKGGIEEDESAEDAAVREVREETGLVAEIEASLGETRYFYVWEDVRIRKTVHFFLMRHTGGNVEDRDDEMEEIRWFPLERALKRAAYRGERDVLGRAAEMLR